jgi:RHS repeat-associated protein
VYVDAMVLRERGSERVYALQDGNWNTTALIAASGVPGKAVGEVIQRMVYNPYGEVFRLNADWTEQLGAPLVAWQHLFQGLKFSEATGLGYVRNRDYSPTLGRFIELDPIGFDAGDNNWYRFVGNGPVGAVDPTGTRIYIIWVIKDLEQAKIADAIKRGNEVCDKAIEKLKGLKDSDFERMKKEGKILFNEEKFKKTKVDLIAMIEREKLSSGKAIDENDADQRLGQIENLLTANAGELNQAYDEMGLIAHGYYDANNTWTGEIKIGGNGVLKQKVIDSFIKAYPGPGKRVLVSCGLSMNVGDSTATGRETGGIRLPQYYNTWKEKDADGKDFKCKGFGFTPYKISRSIQRDDKMFHPLSDEEKALVGRK